MTRTRLSGIILIGLGLAALAYQCFRYTKREKAADLWPVAVTVEQARDLPVSPIIAGAALLGGIALLFTDARRRHV